MIQYHSPADWNWKDAVDAMIVREAAERAETEDPPAAWELHGETKDHGAYSSSCGRAPAS